MTQQAPISIQNKTAPTAAANHLISNANLPNQAHQIFKEPLQGLPIQCKLTIGAVNDPLEYEADSMADKVMRMPKPNMVQRKCSQCEEEGKLQPKPPESFIQRRCNHCEEEENDGIAQQKPLVSFIQKKENNKGNASASDAITSQIKSTKGGGNNMDHQTQTFMESRFGTSFQDVRIHTGNYASDLSQQLHAQAFTVGNDVYFNQNKYAPETNGGKQLLAHELTHTIQQKNGEIINRTPTVDEQKIIDNIKSTYHVKDVVDGDAAFNAPLLKLVFDALAKIPAADLPAIKDVIIKRVITEGPDSVAVYSPRQAFDATHVADEHFITITNLASTLSKDEVIRAIVHEVGHAIANSAIRVATGAAYKAGFEQNKARQAYIDKNNEALALPQSTAAADRKAKWVEVDALKADFDAKKADSAAKDQQRLNSMADITVFTDAAKNAKTACDTEFTNATAALVSNDAAVIPYARALQASQAAVLKFYDGQVVKNTSRQKDINSLNPALQAVQDEIKKRNDALTALKRADPKNAAITTFDPLLKAQDNLLKAAFFAADNIGMSVPVKRFYDFVTTNHIVPTTAFSAYAVKTWPDKPGEFYAESYSFFITDPKHLETFSKPLFDWFKRGDYK